MRRPVRRSRLIAVASLAMLVGSTVVTVSPAALAAGPKAGASAMTRDSKPQAGSRGSVDASKLARSARSSEARPHLPFLSNASTTARPAAPSGSGQVKPFALTPPVLVTPTLTPEAGGPEWDGLSFADSLHQPPDPWVAVGPEHVVQSVNTIVQMYDRIGNVTLGPREIGADELFALPPGFGNSDPRFIYDSLHGRWIGTEVSWTCDGNGDGTSDDPIGYIDFIASRTADPTGIWDLYFIGFAGELPDYPAPGTSTDKLAFTANMFTLNPVPNCIQAPVLNRTELVITDWADVLAFGGSNGFVDFQAFALVSPEYNTGRVGVQVPATSATLHYVAERTTGVFPNLVFTPYYTRITGTVAANNIAFPVESQLTDAGIVAETITPTFPVQPGGPPPVTTSIDSRPTDAIWQNGLFTWVSTNGCTPVATEQACVRVTQLNTGGAVASPPTLAQDFLIGEDGKDNYFGGIGQSGNGTLHVVWTRSSATAGDEPASQTAYQLPTDAVNTLRGKHEIANGTGAPFTGTRWGDYVGVAQDPQVPNAVWQANQYSTGGQNWQTTVSQLQTGGATYVAIAPLRVLDSRINVGVTGIFNASSPKTFIVGGFTSPAGNIPTDAIAVTGNLTVVGQTAGGYVSITTAATSTPRTATLNFPVKDTRGNNVTTPLAGNGRLAAVYKAAAGKRAHLIFDVTGYFLPGPEDAGYNTVDPIRMLDSRTGKNIGLTGRFVSGAPRQLAIAGVGPIPSGAVAITANLTVVGQTKGGFVSVTPTNVPNPTTANLNFPAGDTRGNGLTAKLSGTGTIFLVYKAAAGARTDLILDVTGYYLPTGTGLAFFPLDPGRIVDTRSSAVLSGLTGSLLSSSPRTLDTAGHWGVGSAAQAITGNLTITGQTKGGFVSITPTPIANPTTSSINFPLGDTRGNGVTVPLNGSGDMSLVYKSSAGKRTHVILDVTGYFE